MTVNKSRLFGLSAVAASLVVAGVAAVGTAEAVAPAWSNGVLTIDENGTALTVNAVTLSANKTETITGAGGAVTLSTQNQFITTTGAHTYTLNVIGTGAYTISGFGEARNDATVAHGAIAATSSFTLTNAAGTMTFSGNKAVNTGTGQAQGGAIWTDGSLSIANTVFTANEAKSAGGARGGAIQMFSASGHAVSISGSTFSSNKATGTGTTANGSAAYAGGVQIINGSTVAILNSTFSGNIADTTGTNVDSQAGHAGMYIVSGAQTSNVTLTNVDFTNNEAKSNQRAIGGGLGISNANTVLIAGGEFSGNTVTGKTEATGAAMWLSGIGDAATDIFRITGTTFTGNIAQDTDTGQASGGAVLISQTTAGKALPVFADVTFTGNKTIAAGGNAQGGAIHTDSALTITAATKDVVFSGNEVSSLTAGRGANGGAIFTNSNLTINATGGNIIFSGNKTNAVGATGVANDIHFYNTGTTPTLTLNAASDQTITLGGGVTSWGNVDVLISGAGKTVVTAQKAATAAAATAAPFLNAGTLKFGNSTGTNGVLAVHAKAADLDTVTTTAASSFFFAGANTTVTAAKANIDYSSISTLLFTTALDGGNKHLTIQRKSGGDMPIVSSSVGAAVASYDPTGTGGHNDLISDVGANSQGQHSDAERLEMGYNAASGIGAAQQGAAALGGVYGVMDGVFSGNFAHGGGGVYRGQSPCDPCAPACGRSRLERAVWVMPIYGHQDAKGLHSGGINYGYTSDQYAAVFGAEVKSGHTRLGIAGNAGIGRAVSGVGLVHTNSDLTYGGVSLYAVRKFGRVESNAQVGWIGTKNEMRQNNAGTRVAADIKGGVIYAALGFERPYHYGNLTLAPIFGLEFTHLYQNGFATRVGGTAQFNAQSGNANMLHLPLGLKASANYKTRYGQWSPMVKARVLPHVGDHELAFSNLATGSTTAATLHGIVSDTVAGDVTLGSSLKRGRTELGAGYTVLFSEHFTNQNVSLLLKRTF